MFDLDAMQEADDRLREVLDQARHVTPRAKTTAHKVSALVDQTNSRIARSARLGAADQPRTCPMGHHG